VFFLLNWKPHAKVQVLLGNKISPIFSTWSNRSIYLLLSRGSSTEWCFLYLNCCGDSSFSLFLFFKMDMNWCFSVHMYMNRRLAALCCHHLYAGIHNLTNIVPQWQNLWIVCEWSVQRSNFMLKRPYGSQKSYAIQWIF